MDAYKPSNTQQLIWAGHQLNLESPHSNMAFAFYLDEHVDIDTFTEALFNTIRNCDVLNMRFHNVEQAYFSDQLPDVEIQESLVDPEAWMIDETRRPFDPKKSLYKTAILQSDSKSKIWYFKIHHLITDGWSFALLQKNVCERYEELLKGSDDEPKLFEFKEYLNRTENKNSNPPGLWKQKLEKLPLPNPFFGRIFKDFINKTHRVHINLTIEQVDEIKRLLEHDDFKSWTYEQSLYIFFLSITHILVGRFTGTNIPVVGTPFHGRTDIKQKNTVGPFLKIFPLKVELQEKDSFSEVFNKCKIESNDILKNSIHDASSVELLKKFNSVFNFITTKFYHSETISMKSEWLDSGFCDPGHAVKIQVYNFNDETVPKITIDFSEQIFDESHRLMFIHAFNTLLKNILDSEGAAKISSISIEDLKLVDEFNRTTKELATTKSIIDEFETLVNDHPHKTAIIFEGKKYTYRDLDLQSNQIAHFISRQICPEQGGRIGVCLDRSFELIITLLGTVKSGAAYVPLDTNLPLQRINQIYRESDLSGIFVNENIISSMDAEVNTLSVSQVLSESEDSATINKSNAGNLFYIIYTSGSTGSPKGVMNRMAAVMNRLYWARDYHQLNPEKDLILHKTSIGFDVSVWELFLPLMTGVPLLLAKPNGQMDSSYLIDLIEKFGVTIIHFVPSMLEVFLLTLKEGACPTLRQVVCSGEALKPEHVEKFKSLLPYCTLHNLYGPTEAAIDVTALQVYPGKQFSTSIPIGKPVYNTQIRILNSDLQQAPIGEKGNIFIGGAQLAEGYYKNSSLTDKSFVTLKEFNGHKFYNTGDEGYWLSDGNIIYSGRSDSQVKLRGNRVELGEIENVLLSVPKIEKAAVVLINDDDIKYLSAVIVASENLSEKEILNYLQARLPHYMVPSYVVFEEDMPLNLSGKIDRKQLVLITKNKVKKPELQVEPPTTEIEMIVHDIWCDVLNQNKIGLHDSFYSLGGDSLTGIKTVVKVNSTLDLELPVVSILREHTIYRFSKYIENTLMKLLAE
ncbi:non-ribosomal peptide synthetase [Portibacter marinus]|uniref:non-ribosomal peptide synthetase n=1 Tax=Portibacter marinus TaxID=2898660 RepID=UPI001F2E8EF4|nr:non-ribosomal peptide synthetase [Portibacter marinus]